MFKTMSLFCLVFSVLFVTSFAQNSAEKNVELKVKNLLSKMTIEEKIGQMTQVTVQVISEKVGSAESETVIDPDKMKMAVVDYKVGSLLNVWDVALSPEKWHKLITQIQDMAINDTRLKIPVIYGIDAIHGANYTIGATLFPQNLAMAATWNRELVLESSKITAKEVRACGIPWNFNPVLGLGRNPLWPRLFETFGEDPYAASVFGTTYIEGNEGPGRISENDRVAACMKHYAGYSYPLSGRDRTPAWIPERMLRDLFLVPFKAAVDAGVHTVMVNSSEINGVPVHASHFLLTEVLREEMGFKGLVVTDWADIINLHTREKVADSPKEAVRMAVMAGNDMSMVPYDFSFFDLLLELVNEGSVPMERIDEAVSRILRLKFELGLFENPYPQSELIKVIGTEESRQVSLEAASEAITLLKNDGAVLPLKKGTKILVTGPTANGLRFLNGGWSYTWQGNVEKLYPEEKFTIKEALEKYNGVENVVYVPGTDIDKEIDINAAVKAAEEVGAVILCLGENAYCETPGNINDLNLPKAQIKLAKALINTEKPVILVLAEGRPRLITDIAEEIPAILMAFLPGNEGGPAINDVLFGVVNPSGKLPITYPKYHNQLMTYDHKISETSSGNEYDVLYPFGWGLSYTTFAYEDLNINKKSFGSGEKIEVSVNIVNKGEVAGKEAVLLYVADLYRSITPSVRQLKRFKKIELQPGEEKTIKFTLTDEDLSFIGLENKRIIEPGTFKIMVAGLEKEFELK